MIKRHVSSTFGACHESAGLLGIKYITPTLILKTCKKKQALIYIHAAEVTHLFGSDVLKLLGLVDKVVCISLGNKFALIRLLNKIFIALLLRE
jgi:hypothetical protein